MLYNRNIFTFLNRGKIYMSKIKKHLQEEFEDWEKSVLQCGCQDSGSGRRHNR